MSARTSGLHAHSHLLQVYFMDVCNKLTDLLYTASHEHTDSLEV
jgi:hypothetical protein